MSVDGQEDIARLNGNPLGVETLDSPRADVRHGQDRTMALAERVGGHGRLPGAEPEQVRDGDDHERATGRQREQDCDEEAREPRRACHLHGRSQVELGLGSGVAFEHAPSVWPPARGCKPQRGPRSVAAQAHAPVPSRRNEMSRLRVRGAKLSPCTARS